MTDLAIKLAGVSKYYKLYGQPKDRLKEALHPFGKKYHEAFYALKDFSLEIPKGEVLGVVGRNGSGKSTLLKLICGVLSPSEGTVEINGKISALLELGAGFNPEFTGLQNIHFYLAILGLSPDEIEAVVGDIIEFADIGGFINQPLKSYSSGMKARLSFAVAVHVEPEILILDEVMAVGDALFRRKCYSKMEEFLQGGKTIIYVSHDINSINELCSSAILIDSGEKLLQSDPKTVTAYYQRYLFADGQNRESVKKEILGLSTGGHKDSLDAKKVRGGDGEDKTPAEIEQADLFYIPDFRSKNRMEYKNYDVEIVDPHIETTSGQRVNLLVVNQQYIYTFLVKFGVDGESVSFGTQIKNIKGTKITGAALYHDNRCISVKKGESYRIEWRFNCRLLEGTYFTNTGVSALIESERIFLNRITDAAAFRVQRSENPLWQGTVHLDQEMVVIKQAAEKSIGEGVDQ